jgi:hypothetical protein
MPIVTLYRAVGPVELKLIEESGWTQFPARLPEQPYFYPVLTLEYADQTTRQWNVPEFGSGHVTEFDVDEGYLARFAVKQVGGPTHRELWVPAEELEAFNARIRGPIRVVRSYHRQSHRTPVAEFVADFQPFDEVLVSFDWNGEHGAALKDRNAVFRGAVCEYFLNHKADTPIALVAALYTAETRLAQESWGVHRIVSDLAQELLERGGVDYADIYLEGMSCGMDAFLESGRISLTDKRRDELIVYCNAQRQAHMGTNKDKQYEFLQHRLEAVPSAR